MDINTVKKIADSVYNSMVVNDGYQLFAIPTLVIIPVKQPLPSVNDYCTGQIPTLTTNEFTVSKELTRDSLFEHMLNNYNQGLDLSCGIERNLHANSRVNTSIVKWR